MLAEMKQLDTDVLVIGAGLAGITAALWAARSGARVCITANGEIGSGSSFYPGTWGLGLIGPESKEDEADLMEVILEIGREWRIKSWFPAWFRGYRKVFPN